MEKKKVLSQKLQMIAVCSMICMVFVVAAWMARPMEARADWEASWCHSYEELKEAAENGKSLYVDPDGFTWPSQEVTLTISGEKTIYIGDGTWNIPSNVTLELSEEYTAEGYVKYPGIKSNSGLRVEGTVSSYSEHTLSSLDLTLAKGGKILCENGLYVGESHTLTVEEGADLTESVRLDGTLTGQGTASGRIDISGGYMSTDTNAVISGTITCTGLVWVLESSGSQYNATLTIPKGASVSVYDLEVDNATVMLKGELVYAAGTNSTIRDGGKIVMDNATLTVKSSAAPGTAWDFDGPDKLVTGTGTIYLEAKFDTEKKDWEEPNFFSHGLQEILWNPSCLDLYIDTSLKVETNGCSHEWTETVLKEATATSNGEGMIQCSICGAERTYEIEYEAPAKTDISNFKITLSSTSYTYDGKAKKPGVTLKNGTSAISSGNYTVTYKNNVNVGTATVIVTGKEGKDYTGTVSATFKIQVKNGATYTVGANKYKVTSSSAVSFAGLKSSSTKKVTIPKTVKIGGKSFQVTAISAKALKGTKVTSVTVGENVKTIGSSAFENCKSLSTITIKSTNLKTVGKNSLKGIKSAAKIKVPSSKLTAYKKLLKGKGQGSKVTITKLL